MFTLSELYKSIDNLNDDLDSNELDTLLLRYIKWLCYYDDFEKANDLSSRLSPRSIMNAEGIIKNFSSNPVLYKEEYLKATQPQSKRNKSDIIDYTWSLNRLEASNYISSERKDDYYTEIVRLKELREKAKLKKLKIKWKSGRVEKTYFIKFKRELFPVKKTKSNETISPLKKYQKTYDIIYINRNSFLEKWHKEWVKLARKQKKFIEGFIYLWISFNVLYETTTKADWDNNSWNEFLEKEEVRNIWDSIKQSQEFVDFNDYLRFRQVYDITWALVQTSWLFNMKTNTLYQDWDFWDDLKKYIWVIYRIRNNLFHGWKKWDDSDNWLIEKANISFLVFLDNLYWFSD